MTFLDYVRKYGLPEAEKRWLKNEKASQYYQERKARKNFPTKS